MYIAKVTVCQMEVHIYMWTKVLQFIWRFLVQSLWRSTFWFLDRKFVGQKDWHGCNRFCCFLNRWWIWLARRGPAVVLILGHYYKSVDGWVGNCQVESFTCFSIVQILSDLMSVMISASEPNSVIDSAPVSSWTSTCRMDLYKV